MDDLEQLGEQLRSLPKAAVPSELLGKLLADIPERPEAVRRPRTQRKWTTMFVAAAAVLLVAAAIAVWNRPAVVDQERAVSASYVVYRPTLKQETDPCAILPPLPDAQWQSF